MQEKESDMGKEFFNGAIPKAIVKRALQEFPKDLSLRQQFADQYRHFQEKFLIISDATKSGVEELFASIQTDFASDADALAYLAERFVANVSLKSSEFPAALKSTVQHYTKFISNALNEDLRLAVQNRYADFLRAHLEKAQTVKSTGVEVVETLITFMSKSLARLMEK